ncbi:MAG: hypothetical protein IPM86_04880 [Saprospiraceae bacterium]|nr:hypothetical protein [Saprospiraceae bacterium]
MKFNLHTKLEWMELIRKDLFDKNQHAPTFESSLSFNGNPFVHFDDLNFDLKPAFYSVADVSKSIRIPLIDALKSNQFALRCLNFGVSKLTFIVDQELNDNDLQILMNSIRPEFVEIEWIILIENDEVKYNIINYYSKYYPQISPSIYYPHSYSVIEDIDRSAVVLTPWMNLLNKYHEFCQDSAESEYFKIDFRMSSDFLNSIIQLRCLNLILSRIAELLNYKKVNFTIATCVRYPGESNDELIENSTRSVAAYLGGAAEVFMECSESEMIADSNLLSLIQIPEILERESGLSKVQDPLYGSHFIESNTEALCSRLWNNWVNRF